MEFRSFPAPLPYIIYIIYSFTKKEVALQKYIFAPGKTEGNFTPAKNGHKSCETDDFSVPFLWTFFVDLGVPFFGWNPFIFAKHVWGMGPQTNPNQSAANRKRKFRRPMLRSWNKWKPCIASYKPINPRWASGFTSLQYSLCWENVGFWGGFGETQRMSEWEDCIGLCVFFFFSRGDRCVWFKSGWKKWLFLKLCCALKFEVIDAYTKELK